MLTIAAAGTFQGKANTAAVITYTLFGDLLTTADSFGVIAQGQLPSAVGVLYTVPASTSALVKEIVLANTSAIAVSGVQFFVNGAAVANQILGNMTIPANGSAVYANGIWQVYDQAGTLATGSIIAGPLNLTYTFASALTTYPDNASHSGYVTTANGWPVTGFLTGTRYGTEGTQRLQSTATGQTFARAWTGSAWSNFILYLDTGDVPATLKSAGAVANGTADDRAAFVSLDASLPANYGINVSEGRYRILTNLTITRPLNFESGARIVVPTGVTITINSAIKADVEWIFELEGTGAVLLSADYNVDRFPEWWGAVVGADCSPAFVQCIKAGTVTHLQARDYVTSATMAIPAYATVQGAGYNWEGANTATRILLASPSVTPIIQLGSTGTPVDLNSAPANACLMDVYATRNQAPNAATVSILVAWSRFARLERVRGNTSITIFRVTNAISPFIVDCFAKRDVAIAAGQGADSFIGWDIDGTGALPAAGGNASVWLTRPQTELNITIAGSTGYWIHGRFTDTFITQPETLGTAYGIDVLGDKGGAGQAAGSNANLIIENPVVDQTKTIGIRVQNVNQWGAVQIIQPYVGPSTGDGITVSNCDGHVGILGGQARMNVSTAGKGVTFDTCRSPTLHNMHIAECSTQALVLNNVTGGQFQPIIQNVTAQLSAAVQSVGGVVKTSIRPSINGAAGKVTYALQSLATSNINNVVSTAAVAAGVVTTLLSYAAGAEAGTTYPDLQQAGAVAAMVAQFTSAIVTTAQQITGASYVIPANSIAVGTTYRLKITGTGDNTAASPTFAFSVRIGAALIATAIIPSITAGGAGKAFTVEALLTFRTIGAAGTVVGSVAALNELATAFTGAVNIDSPVAVAANTTTALTIDLAFTLGTATAGNLIRAEMGTVELVRV